MVSSEDATRDFFVRDGGANMYSPERTIILNFRCDAETTASTDTVSLEHALWEEKRVKEKKKRRS